MLEESAAEDMSPADKGFLVPADVFGTMVRSWIACEGGRVLLVTGGWSVEPGVSDSRNLSLANPLQGVLSKPFPTQSDMASNTGA